MECEGTEVMDAKFKVAYEVMALEVDKLYPPYYVLKPDETIEQHLMDIEAFIESCGWTTEEYLSEYIHRGLKDLFLDPKEMN
jgi:predicted nuclease of restriction endonuclease-like RecB superfamily